MSCSSGTGVGGQPMPPTPPEVPSTPPEVPSTPPEVPSTPPAVPSPLPSPSSYPPVVHSSPVVPNVDLVEVGRVGVFCSVEHFSSAVDVWIHRPQVINRRLLGAIVSEQGAGVGSGCHRELLPRQQRIPHGHEDVWVSEGRDMFLFTSCQQIEIDSGGQDGCCSGPQMEYQLSYVRDSEREQSVRLKIPAYLCHGHTPPLAAEPDPVPNRSTIPSVTWLVDVLLPKVAQWAGEGGVGGAQPDPTHPSLVPLDRFAATYSRMKEQYGRPLVQDWPESTDPNKFVYEDISIAAYLLVLWEVEREELGQERRQSFVDLGCGNGLLVYLLASEGHPGKGIDLQRRKVWQRFEPPAVLEERSIVPSDVNLFPDCDWLLGNHSDELTPWIPMIAARSSYKTKFFVLPCCTHDFVGRYARPGCDVSQYRSYLQYVSLIARTAGFVVQEDTLRIPSSKRVCIIGQQRCYLATEEEKMEEARCAFLKERCQGKPPSLPSVGTSSRDHTGFSDDVIVEGPSHKWSDGFTPRPKSSTLSRNCSQLDPRLREHIVATVAEVLLQSPLRHDGRMRVVESNATWHRGGSLPLEEVAVLFDGATLVQLKEECGGLQTLLRNHHQVFEVESGRVRIRNWSAVEDHVQPSTRAKSRPKRGQRAFHKTKLCWFAQHHPQGCPRGDGTCTYAHCKEELRERPNFENVLQMR